MPVFAAEVYGGGADTLGWLMAAAGAGSLLGAVALAQRTGEAGLERLAGVAGLVGASGLLALAMLGALYQGLMVLPLVGFALTIVIAAANILVQLRIPDQLRGRAVALFSVVFLGASPIGNLLAGAVAEAVGVRVTVAGCALLLGAGALIYMRDLGGRTSAGTVIPEEAQP
jgi:predicted MFS family arabinose efflux permease